MKLCMEYLVRKPGDKQHPYEIFELNSERIPRYLRRGASILSFLEAAATSNSPDPCLLHAPSGTWESLRSHIEESITMDKNIKDALEQAYAGEAKAALRLKIFADVAEGEGYPRIAKLFRVISFSEGIHGTRALRVLKETGNTEENLKNSFESEEKVARVAYGEFLAGAIELGDKAAAQHFLQSRDVEEGHARLYKNALNDMMSERDTIYHVCTVCGYVSDGVLPDECPVCGAKKEKFAGFD